MEFFKKIKSLFYKQYPIWNIGIIPTYVGNLINGIDEKSIQWFPLNKKMPFAADPFIFLKNNKLYIFFEFVDDQHNGKIACCTFSEKGFSEPAEIELENNLHTSYPFILEHESEIFLLTENYKSGKFILYKASDFPHKWVLEKVLFEDKVVDPTVFYYNATFWLFYSLEGKGNVDKELHIRFADNPRGPWKEHPLNPVKSDITSSRPAGGLFFKEGALFRPAQNCSINYGYNICINQILKLTEEFFEEKKIKEIGPLKKGPYISGMHTLNGNAKYTVIDARKIVMELRSIEELKTIFEKKIKTMRYKFSLKTGII